MSFLKVTVYTTRKPEHVTTVTCYDMMTMKSLINWLVKQQIAANPDSEVVFHDWDEAEERLDIHVQAGEYIGYIKLRREL